MGSGGAIQHGGARRPGGRSTAVPLGAQLRHGRSMGDRRGTAAHRGERRGSGSLAAQCPERARAIER